MDVEPSSDIAVKKVEGDEKRIPSTDNASNRNKIEKFHKNESFYSFFFFKRFLTIIVSSSRKNRHAPTRNILIYLAFPLHLPLSQSLCSHLGFARLICGCHPALGGSDI